VSGYVLKGADLMAPGVAVPAGGLPRFATGAAIAILSPGNPAPIGVGFAALSSEEAMARGGRGRLVELIQHFGDALWAEYGRPTPNEGFFPTMVVPIGSTPEAVLASIGAEEEAEGDEESGSGGEEDGGGGEAAAGGGEAAWPDAAGALGAAVQRLGLGAAAEPVASAAAAPSDAAAAAAAEPPAAAATAAAAAVTPAAMDAFLEAALLQALHRSIKDADLPLNPAQLWNGHLLAAKPPGCAALDVKKSGYKKMSKFLQVGPFPRAPGLLGGDRRGLWEGYGGVCLGGSDGDAPPNRLLLLLRRPTAVHTRCADTRTRTHTRPSRAATRRRAPRRGSSA